MSEVGFWVLLGLILVGAAVLIYALLPQPPADDQTEHGDGEP